MNRPVGSKQPKLFRFALTLWMIVGAVVLLVPWPYALGAVLFATFLHFASLVNPPMGAGAATSCRSAC